MNIARLLRHLYNTDLKQDYIKTIEGQNDIEMSDIKSKEIIPTIEEFEHSRIETNKKLNDNIDVFDIMSDRASSRDTMVLPPNSYFDVTRMNMHGQTPLFIAVCNQSTDMFDFLLECQSDITQKELQHGESVRDCVFRYCQITEEYNSPLSLLSDDTDSIVQIYKRNEANIMIQTLTRGVDSKAAKIGKVLLHMRNDLIFVRQAAKFIIKTLLGEDGPQRLLQVIVFSWYLILSILLIFGMGFSKLTLFNAILALVAILTFIWVNIAPQGKQRKFNLMMDLQNPRHLISSVVKKLERKEFESLERDTSELNLHCYECLLVKTPHMHHCKRCDACIEYRHKHSKFIGKCIGRDNSIAYFYFMLTNVLLNGLLCYSLGQYALV